MNGSELPLLSPEESRALVRDRNRRTLPAASGAVSDEPVDVRTLLRDRIMRPIGVRDEDWSIGYGATYTVDGLPLVAQIKKARPDLIVASSDVDPHDLERARSATNAAVFTAPAAQ